MDSIEILWHWKFVMSSTCKKNTLLVTTSRLWNEHILGLWFASQFFSMLLSTWTNLALQYVLFWYQNFQIQLGNFLFYYNTTFQHKNSMWKHDNETSKCETNLIPLQDWAKSIYIYNRKKPFKLEPFKIMFVLFNLKHFRVM